MLPRLGIRVRVGPEKGEKPNSGPLGPTSVIEDRFCVGRGSGLVVGGALVALTALGFLALDRLRYSLVNRLVSLFGENPLEDNVT
jgi:hypothetical protein